MAKANSVSEVRSWARGQGFVLADRGRLPAEVWAAWEGRGPSKRTRPASPPVGRSAAPPSVASDDVAALAKDLASTAQDLNTMSREFVTALARIDQLEKQVEKLSHDLAAPEQPPRRRFARSR